MYSSGYGDIVTIEVGNQDNKQTFRVHKGFLSFYSGYFKAALEGAWAESKSGIIKLETEDPLVFERFVHWLYTNKITDDQRKSEFRIIIGLWLFADRRDIPLLMNEMIDALHKEIANSWLMPTDFLHKVYESTTKGSALRRMLMWTMSRIMRADMFNGDYAERWPRTALLDMVKLVLAERPAATMTQDQYKKVKMCPLYHVHEEGALCAEKLET